MRRVSLLNRREEFDATMTPMIDVVFLLLIFFVWTASFQIAEQLLPGTVALPPAGQGAPAVPDVAPEDDFDPVVIRIAWRDEQPAWELQGNPIEGIAALRSRLADVAKIRKDAPVVIHPDSDVPLGFVIDAYDSARVSGFLKIQFATPYKASP